VCDLIRQSEPHLNIVRYAVSLLYRGKGILNLNFRLGPVYLINSTLYYKYSCGERSVANDLEGFSEFVYSPLKQIVYSTKVPMLSVSVFSVKCLVNFVTYTTDAVSTNMYRRVF
jgi:hypothetical protein